MQSCFHPDATIRGTRFSADLAEYLPRFQSELEKFERTVHFLGTQQIRVEADQASLETCAIARHFWTDQESGPQQMAIGVRYLDDLRRDDGAWTIGHRAVELEWSEHQRGRFWPGLDPLAIVGRARQRDPMIPYLSPEQLALRHEVRKLLGNRAPMASVRQAMLTDPGYDPGVWRALSADMGLVALAIDEANGGVGPAFIELAIVLEELRVRLDVEPLACLRCSPRARSKRRPARRDFRRTVGAVVTRLAAGEQWRRPCAGRMTPGPGPVTTRR